ncbi:hypothetical protein BZG02_07085 [Labilibaculum filiforme]|uniref:Uncharacterized protein n=1 Tax=Labilibaculum filiforme TaxID=1940526 RepID=A0A2N3I0Y9_9BACT|nr:hypothetical protein BZG02_07085 [Labilibaculum filiforme]
MAIRLNSDETYVIDLCDKVLALTSDRQKRFDFLLGDLHKNGKKQTMLPVDAYYEELQLVVEYKEIQNFRPRAGFDRDEEEQDEESTKTVSREEQRRIYDERRAKVLPEHEISLVVIAYSDFDYDVNNKIIRKEESDLKIVQKALKAFC